MVESFWFAINKLTKASDVTIKIYTHIYAQRAIGLFCYKLT